MKTVKKTPVKKYTKGGPKTSMLDKRIAKKTAKRDALVRDLNEDSSKGMESYTKASSRKLNKVNSKLNDLATRSIKKTYTSPTKAANKTTGKELENLGKKRGGTVSKMKRGGTTKKK